MKGFVQDIERIAIGNTHFRQVLYTARNCQLVVMGLEPMGEIGSEVHELDQFFRVEEGTDAPPNHRDGVVHHTRDEAEADTEHFDGKTTE